MLCCLNPYCDDQPNRTDGTPNPVNPDKAKRCQYCQEPLIPLLRNRFKPLKVLGQGGFGRTYLAEDADKLNRPCVLKQLLPQGGSKAVELFQREAEQLDNLGQNHLQIPLLISFFQENNALFLVQQFIEGESLSRELEQGIWAEPKVRQFLQDILPVLQFIHERGVIHRDINPDNLMRRKDTGQIVLIDFGLSKQLKGSILAVPGTRAESYGYGSIEQMEGGEAYPASDLFSVGATCFHLLSGQHPHSLWVRQGYGWVSTWQRYLKQPLSPELTRILDKLLREEHTRRYQSAEEVLGRLNQTPKPQLEPAQPQPAPLPRDKTNPTVPVPQPAADPFPIIWLLGVAGSYALVGWFQAGGEDLLVKSNAQKYQEMIVFTRIFWGLGLPVLGTLTAPLTEKDDSIVGSVAGVVAGAGAGTGALSVAGALAWAGVLSGALAGDVAWAWTGAGALPLSVALALAVAWAGAVARALSVALAVAWVVAVVGATGTEAKVLAGICASFGIQLWISILAYVWAIQQPANPVRRLSWLMAVLSLLLGGWCFYVASQTGEPILPGVVVGAGVMGILALVVTTLVGAGKGLAASSLSYWQRLVCFAVPVGVGLAVGYSLYGVLPWAESLSP